MSKRRAKSDFAPDSCHLIEQEEVSSQVQWHHFHICIWSRTLRHPYFQCVVIRTRTSIVIACLANASTKRWCAPKMFSSSSRRPRLNRPSVLGSTRSAMRVTPGSPRSQPAPALKPPGMINFPPRISLSSNMHQKQNKMKQTILQCRTKKLRAACLITQA